MKCKKYQLLAESTNLKLTKDVNTLVDKGWELYGYPFFIDGFFLQAMIKVAKDKTRGVDDKE